MLTPIFSVGDWVTVPTNSILSINKQTVLIHPIMDQYYQQDPSYSRSTQFAESKGMVGIGPAEVEKPDTPSAVLATSKVVDKALVEAMKKLEVPAS